mmetsp:Transcript_83835/g.232334  ORF Transcript_83835/g.232334 Transcript_83835/m.232334 type:complete len:188 (-) Transcript_83835:76-639(-)
MERRRDVAEKMRLHLKATLAQCLPPAQDAPRSRYSRFEASSPAANAVQLGLEAADFLGQLADSLPAVRQTLREAVADARAGAGRGFRAAPGLSRWREWLPDPAGGGELVGFGEFAGRYEAALGAYDEQLARGGRLAALHSTKLRWEEIEAELSSIEGELPAAVEVPSVAAPATLTRAVEGFWALVGA